MNKLTSAADVYFRVEGGGYGVGLGHVYRCLRIASQLQKSGINSVFVIGHNKHTIELVNSRGYQVLVLDRCLDSDTGDGFKFLDKIRGILYIDLRGKKRHLVECARSRGIVVVVYDDIYESAVLPDVLINPSECDRDLYTACGVEYMLGSRYIILDPELRGYRKSRFSEDIKRIFVCFGGADPCNVTFRVVKRLLDSGYSGWIDVALGGAYHGADEMRALESSAANLVLHEGVNFLAPIMVAADAAITSGGTLMCEAIALAMPVLVLPTIAHEVVIAETYKGEGLIASISCDVTDLHDNLLDLAIFRFIGSVTGRRVLYEAQVAEIKFNGCEEVARKLRELIR